MDRDELAQQQTSAEEGASERVFSDGPYVRTSYHNVRN